MNCKEVMEASSLYLSRELDADRAAEVLRHLGSCPACSRVMEEWVDADTRLQGALLAESVDTSSIERAVRAKISSPSRRWIGLAAASIAAAIVIAFATVKIDFGTNRTCLDAANDHHREVINGEKRRWLVEASAISQLAGTRGISMPQLGANGYSLERGKLCRLDGRIYLHLVYTDGSGEVSMFLSPREKGSAAGIRNFEAGAEHVAYFDTTNVNAIVVTDQSTESATRAARVAEQSL